MFTECLLGDRQVSGDTMAQKAELFPGTAAPLWVPTGHGRAPHLDQNQASYREHSSCEGLCSVWDTPLAVALSCNCRTCPGPRNRWKRSRVLSPSPGILCSGWEQQPYHVAEISNKALLPLVKHLLCASSGHRALCAPPSLISTMHLNLSDK